MADGQLEVTVGSTVTGDKATLTAHVNSNNQVVVVAPAPGSFTVDPRTQLPELQDALRILGDVALKRSPQGQES